MSEMTHRVADRRVILGAAIVMDMAFGAVQAWSVFRNPLIETFGWTVSAVTLAYTVHYVSAGVGAVLGDLWITRVGPWRAGAVAGLLYGGGVFLAAFTAGRLCSWGEGTSPTRSVAGPSRPRSAPPMAGEPPARLCLTGGVPCRDTNFSATSTRNPSR